MFSSDLVVSWVINALIAVAIVIAGRYLAKWASIFLKRVLVRARTDLMLVDFIGNISYWLLVLVVVIIALDRVGVNTTSLVALVGAAGLAVGLALKDSLGNFAAGVMLLVFRPFKAGDFIKAAGVAGSVERIGIFCTELKTPDNQQVIIPNGSIYAGVITNVSAHPTRRVDLVVGIGYGDDIAKAKQIVMELLQADGRILAEPEAVVAVSELADSSVNLVVRPWCKSKDYWGLRFDLTEAIKSRFDQEGISIPFPQMDVHINQSGN